MSVDIKFYYFLALYRQDRAPGTQENAREHHRRMAVKWRLQVARSANEALETKLWSLVHHLPTLGKVWHTSPSEDSALEALQMTFQVGGPDRQPGNVQRDWSLSGRCRTSSELGCLCPCQDKLGEGSRCSSLEMTVSTSQVNLEVLVQTCRRLARACPVLKTCSCWFPVLAAGEEPRRASRRHLALTCALPTTPKV